MKRYISRLQTISALIVVGVLCMAIVGSGPFGGAAFASNPTGGQVASRSITMSSSASGSVTTGPVTGTNVTYTVKFTPATTGTAGQGELIVDFCDNSPLYSDTCTVTGAGTDVPNTSSAGGTNASNVTGNHTVKVTGLTFTNGTPNTVTITGITNPTNVGSVGTFYARILTYGLGGAASYVPSGSSAPTLGSPIDYGGVALSTANVITINAKVNETLSFCVYQASCTSGTGNAPILTLGDPTTQALSTSNNYVNSNTHFTFSTNATNGGVIVMRGTTMCRSSGANCQPGGTYGTNTISAIGATATALGTAGSNERFGMCVNNNNNSGIFTVDSTYKDTTATNCSGLTTGTYSGGALFGFDDNTSTGTNSTAGSSVLTLGGAATTGAGTYQFVFGAAITPTTDNGIYTTTLNMVATGLF